MFDVNIKVPTLGVAAATVAQIASGREADMLFGQELAIAGNN